MEVLEVLFSFHGEGRRVCFFCVTPLPTWQSPRNGAVGYDLGGDTSHEKRYKKDDERVLGCPQACQLPSDDKSNGI